MKTTFCKTTIALLAISFFILSPSRCVAMEGEPREKIAEMRDPNSSYFGSWKGVFKRLKKGSINFGVKIIDGARWLGGRFFGSRQVPKKALFLGTLFYFVKKVKGADLIYANCFTDGDKWNLICSYSDEIGPFTYYPSKYQGISEIDCKSEGSCPPTMERMAYHSAGFSKGVVTAIVLGGGACAGVVLILLCQGAQFWLGLQRRLDEKEMKQFVDHVVCKLENQSGVDKRKLTKRVAKVVREGLKEVVAGFDDETYDASTEDESDTSQASGSNTFDDE